MNGGTLTAVSRARLVAAMREEAGDDESWADTERRLLEALERTPDGTVLEVREDFMDEGTVPEDQWTDHEQIAGSIEYFGISNSRVDVLDYYVSARSRATDASFERHAGLTGEEADLLRKVLDGDPRLTDVMVDLSRPEWYTIGYEDTLGAVLEHCDIDDEEDEE